VDFACKSAAYAYAGQVAGNLEPILDFPQLNDFNGVNAGSFVNATQVHRLRRENEIHNIEFNRLWQLSDFRDCSPWSFQALVGFRFFRFVDNLQFAADVSDATIDGDADEFYYDIDVDNDLYGFQVVGLAERQCCRHSRWSLTFGAKVGAFVNDALMAS
jgi:hypothetical protein